MDKQTLEKIADLLPEGLDEAAISEIAKMVKVVIQENVDQRLGDLESKVSAFIRLKVDELKEQAIKELELENDTFRSASIFEHFKNIMTTELKQLDEDSAVSETIKEYQEVTQENEVLTSELDKALQENSELRNAVKALDDKIKLLENGKKEAVKVASQLQEATKLLKEGKFNQLAVEKLKKAGFNSNEVGLVITNTPTETKDGKVRSKSGTENPFINEDVMRLAQR